MSYDLRKYASSRFITVDDVRDGPIQATIVQIIPGRFEKLNLTLDNGRQFGLNKTNVDRLIAAYGPNTDDLIGQHLEFYLGFIPYNGKDQEAVLVRPLSGKSETERTPLSETPDDDSMSEEVPF